MASAGESPATDKSSPIPPDSRFFQPNEIRSATDADFDYFIQLADQDGDGWIKKLDKNGLVIWQKETGVSSIKMAKVRGEFPGVSAGTAFDSILDGGYRKIWDENLIEDYELCRLDDCNDVGYYSMKVPTPLKNRDFVNQRSWRMYGDSQFIIFNHSVSVKALPLKRRFIRGISYMTGFLVRSSENGCTLNYLTQSDPKGNIPSWLINLAINQIAPNVFKKLYLACCKYEEWKSTHSPGCKPWRFPEQNTLPLMDVASLHSENGTRNGNGSCAEQVGNGKNTNQEKMEMGEGEEEEESLPEDKDAEMADKELTTCNGEAEANHS